MTGLFLYWDLFLMMSAPIRHLEPYIRVKDKRVRILEIINSEHPARAEQDSVCFQGLRTNKVTLVTP